MTPTKHHASRPRRDKGPRVFISYRSSDRALAAHWVHREVAARFGDEAVVFDVDGIPAGFDYRDFLQERVSDCDVLLAVIGDDWLDVRDAEGQLRLVGRQPTRLPVRGPRLHSSRLPLPLRRFSCGENFIA